MTDTMHDFGDGLVPAHRHKNPNGTSGGWVADTATVAPTATVTGGATVAGEVTVGGKAWVGARATIAGGATVTGEAWVGGKARIGGTARVDGEARVGSEARVDGDARVGGRARIESSRHVVSVGPVGSDDQTVTVWRHADGTARVAAVVWTGAIDELAEWIAPGGEHGWPADIEARHRADYEAIIALARAREAEWAADAADVPEVVAS